eukprot:751953-Hanusia_phi.AAC.1
MSSSRSALFSSHRGLGLGMRAWSWFTAPPDTCPAGMAGERGRRTCRRGETRLRMAGVVRPLKEMKEE